jgi:hypothetical protein
MRETRHVKGVGIKRGGLLGWLINSVRSPPRPFSLLGKLINTHLNLMRPMYALRRIHLANFLDECKNKLTVFVCNDIMI